MTLVSATNGNNPGSIIVLRADPAPGYKFDGWLVGGKMIVSNTLTYIVGAIQTLTPVFSKIIPDPVKTYKVTFKLNKGKWGKKKPPKTFVYGKGLSKKVIKGLKPTRKGYKFRGWFGKKKGGKKVTSISKTQAKKVTLHARWK